MSAPIKPILVAAVVALTMTFATQAHATPISLKCELGCSNVLFGDAIWSTELTQHPSGTGVFEPFLRLHATGKSTTEDGHNTDAKSQTLLNDEMGGNWTHSLEVSTLALYQINGSNYFGFALDTGEPAAKKKSPLSLDALKLCTSNNPSLTKANDCPTASHFNLDAGSDKEVLLDYNLIGKGNGESDLFVFIPAFKTKDKYLYLYSAFGGKGGAYRVDGTFSEWAASTGPPQAVPEPASLLLFGTGIGAVVAGRRRRRPAVA